MCDLSRKDAGMVDNPEQYKWSSYFANAWGREINLTPHDEYLKLGSDAESRCMRIEKYLSIDYQRMISI